MLSSVVLENYSLELFQVDPTSISRLARDTRIGEVRAFFEDKARELIPDERARYWHLADLLRGEGLVATVNEDQGKYSIVFVNDSRSSSVLNKTMSVYGIKDEGYGINQGDQHDVLLDPLSDGSDFVVFRRLLRESMRQNLPSQFEVDAWEIVDRGQRLEVRTPTSSPLANGVQFYKAASVQMRKFVGDGVFLEIIPKSSIQYSYDLDTLLQKSLVTPEGAPGVFPFVKLASNALAKLVGIYNKTAADPIEDDEVMHGRTFLQFARDMLPKVSLSRPDAPLAAIGTQAGPKVYSSELLHPSVNFSILKSIDPDFFSGLLSKLRIESMKRLDNAVQWVKLLTPLLGLPGSSETLKVEVAPLQIAALREPITADSLSSSDFDSPGARFAAPPMSFRRTRPDSFDIEEFTVFPGLTRDYQGTVNDFLDHPELRPLDAPSKARIIAYVHEPLVKKWDALKTALLDGTGHRGYNGLQQTFGVDISIETEVVDDFLNGFEDNVSKLRVREYDCAIHVLPRWLSNPESTRLVYTEPKIKVMRKGIPVQVIAEDERRTESRDNTLTGKSRNSRVLFGIAINLLAKIGCVLTALSQEFAESMLPKSAVIGYDIARVYPPTDDIDAYVSRKRISVPLAAPLVIFDNRGARIAHQRLPPDQRNIAFCRTRI